MISKIIIISEIITNKKIIKSIEYSCDSLEAPPSPTPEGSEPGSAIMRLAR